MPLFFCLQEELRFTCSPGILLTGRWQIWQANGVNQRLLWKNACISTGRDVQNSAFFAGFAFCPTSVQLGYNAFPAHP
jgi:hypothetical protein